jgi:predicted nucleic acid-binding protein
MESENALLILDEKKARNYAKRHGLRLTGTIGILLDAYYDNLFEDIDIVIDKLKNIGFRMSANINTFTKHKKAQ